MALQPCDQQQQRCMRIASPSLAMVSGSESNASITMHSGVSVAPCAEESSTTEYVFRNGLKLQGVRHPLI